MKNMKLTTLALAGVMAVSAVPAFAATKYTPSDEAVEYYDSAFTSDTSEKCEVYAMVGSTFEVMIPKKVTLSGVEKTGDYEVKVAGNVAGTEKVTVAPAETVTMKQDGKNDVTGTISQAITVFRDSLYSAETLANEMKMGTELATAPSTTGTITAKDLTAGAWNGAFNFTISISE